MRLTFWIGFSNILVGLLLVAAAFAQDSSAATAGVEATLLKEGVLGAIIVALGGGIIWQTQQLKRAQDARVNDAKKVVQMLLELQEKWNEQVNHLRQAIDRLAVLMGEREGRR